MATTTATQTPPAKLSWFGGFDYWLALVAAALLVFGLLVVYSTTFPWSLYTTGDVTFYFVRQVGSMLFGLVIVGVLLRFDYRILRSNLAVYLLAGTVVLLVLVLIVGSVGFGARRSLLNGSIQPGEFAKLAMPIYLAHWLTSKGEKLRSVRLVLLPYAGLVGIVAGLIVLQPDLSTAVLIVAVAGTMFFVTGTPIRHLLLGVVLAAPLLVFAVMKVFYAQERIDEWMRALNNPELATWHTLQALIALGSGGLFGVGFGASAQKFGILPTPHTDSVFAVIGEELGLLGTLAVILLFALLVWRGFKVAQNARDEFGYVLAVGLTCSLAYEALTNVLVMTGMVPFTGVTLPFMSYGGSSLLVSMTSVGLLLNISRGSNRSGRKVRKALAHHDGGWWNGRARLPWARGH